LAGLTRVRITRAGVVHRRVAIVGIARVLERRVVARCVVIWRALVTRVFFVLGCVEASSAVAPRLVRAATSEEKQQTQRKRVLY
jgi:hypothetical protein